MKKILVFGTFDYLHPGRLFLLSKAQEKGLLYVIIGRDDNVLHIKGAYPDHDEEERLQAIQSAFPSAIVRLGERTDFLEPIHTIQPDLIVLGYDQTLPPGIHEKDISIPIERIEAFEPEKWKSSTLRNKKG